MYYRQLESYYNLVVNFILTSKKRENGLKKKKNIIIKDFSNSKLEV